MGHNLAIIFVWNSFFIGWYKIDTNVIHFLILFRHQYHAHCLDTNVIHFLILFKHRYHAHCLNMNVICLFILLRHRCCMFICVVYTQKSCTWLSCLNNKNLWNNRFCRIWNKAVKLINLWCMNLPLGMIA
jgi:hypothetical protein